MSAFFSRFLAVFFVLVICAIPFPKTANAAITVEDRQLVSKRRVGRSAYNYTYKITVKVEGPGVDNAVAYLSCDNPGTTVIDDVVNLGNLETNSTTLSEDTFTIRQNRRMKFDPDCLVWEIGFESTLVISGVVTDEPLSGADVFVVVDYREAGRPIIEAGRPIIESFGGTTEADGSYEVEAIVVAEDAFVTVSAEGTGEQDGAELTSTLGTVGTLQTSGSPGSIMIGEDVTHITTALAVLAANLAGEDILTDEALQAAEAQVPGDDLINLAAAIKTVVDNPEIEIPGGGDFLEFLSDPDTVESFVTETMEENPDEFMEALDETVDDLPLVYDEAELEDTELYTSVVTNNPLVISGGAYQFDIGGTGKVWRFEGASDMDWSVDADGDLVVEPESLSQTFVIFCDAGAGQEQFEQTTTIDEIRLKRIVSGVASDQVFQTDTFTRSAISDCGIAEETTVQEPDPENTFLAVNDSQIIPVDPVELVDGPFVIEFLNVDNENEATNDSRFGADFVSFNGDGTGSTQRSGYNFTWSIDAAGRVNVLFDNGDKNQYVVIAEDEGPITRTVLIADLTNAIGGPAQKAISALAVEPDGMSEFDDAVLTDHRFRSLFVILAPEQFGNTFDFLFEDGGTGCRIFDNFYNPFVWDALDDRVEMTRFFGHDPSIIQRVRTWEGAATVIGTLGNRIWLIENFDFNFEANPVYDATPETEVGRINAYEDLGDFTGNNPPTTVDDNIDTIVDMAITFNPAADDMDSDGHPVSVISVDSISDEGGTIVANFDANFAIVDVTYTPLAGFDGEDRFSYFVTDFQDCAFTEGEVFITIDP